MLKRPNLKQGGMGAFIGPAHQRPNLAMAGKVQRTGSLPAEPMRMALIDPIFSRHKHAVDVRSLLNPAPLMFQLSQIFYRCRVSHLLSQHGSVG